MQRCAFVLAVSCVALLGAREARAAATLMTGLGGPLGYGTTCMPPNDDGSFPAGATGLDLTPAFPKGLHFYAGSYKQGWINNNGSLSFNSAISTYTPNAFPGAPQPMIAPYWADVDTRSTAECGDGQYPDNGGYPASDTCGSGVGYTTDPMTNGVWWSLTPGQMVVTWNKVGFYLCNATPAMSFQMILTATGCGQTIAPDGGVAGVDFDIEFRYSQCGWEAGDASGGTNGFCPAGTVGTTCTPAQAGFDSAEKPTDTDFWSLPSSRLAGVSTELCNNSNLTPAQPGVWKFSIRGGVIECPNAGQPCMTGQPGICAQGQLQCTPSGTTTCVALTGPQPSQCNGLDNNCDGTIDTGPCPTNYSCVGAQCVPNCTEGTCPPGTTCETSGVCIETDCIGVNCPSGQRCAGGKCVDACSGVTCPLGQVCRLGTCVDPCLGLDCGMGQVCDNGTCVPTCQCMPCAAGKTCEMSGLCVATACASVTCPAGQTCETGTCVDDCTGAVCPANQICQAGNCVPHITPYDAGMGLTAPDASGPMPPGDGGTGGDATTSDAGATGDGGGNPFAGVKQTSGCGCRATGSAAPGAAGIGAMLGVLATVLRRRRRLSAAPTSPSPATRAARPRSRTR